MKQIVALVHGVWMTGLEMQWLGLRLRRCGFSVRPFHYPSLRRAPAENAVRLHDYLGKLDADIIHLVAHSLGGIVVSHLFDQFPDQRPGKVVMLGSPLNGSATAMAIHQRGLDRWLLGASGEQGLLGGVPRWRGGRELAMIAGDRGVGIGKLLFRALPEPNDGTVAVDETMTPQVGQHLRVPYSHFGMLFARPVSDAVCAYLRLGRFTP